MRLIVLVGLFCVFLKSKAAEDDSGCHINGIENRVHTIQPPINDTHEGIVANFTTSNVKAINVTSSNTDIYLNATFENNTLQIFTTEQFKDFEKDRKGSFNSKISVEINCECADNSEPNPLAIHVDVNDTNNHDPVFNKNRYEYNFVMTIPIDLDLTLFQTISASDDDFMNNNIDFTTESDAINTYFELGKDSRYENGHYFASLKALQNIPAPYHQEFTIIATDDGNPPISTTATVVINVSSPENSTSENDSDHSPVFSKHLYFANYTLNNALTMEDNVTITYGAKENMAVRQNGYEEYFKISQNNSLKEQLDIQTIQPLTEEILKDHYIVIDIEAQNEGSSYLGLTTLLIHLPSEKNDSNDHPPIFSKGVYFANYTSSHELMMEEMIAIIYGATENMAVRQSGYEEYFKISQNPSRKEEFDVQIIKPLPEENLNDTYIVINIEAKNEGSSSYLGLTTLLIYLPNEKNDSNSLHPPVFSKSFYFANYTLNHTLKMEENITIKYGATNNTTVTQSNYEEYIKVGLNVFNNAELQVEIVKPLNNEILKNDLIVIEITAENEGLSISTHTNLIIRLEKESSSNCTNVVHIFGFTIADTIFPLVLFLSTITMIVFVNVVVLTLYFKKNRANSSTA